MDHKNFGFCASGFHYPLESNYLLSAPRRNRILDIAERGLQEVFEVTPKILNY